VSRDYLESHKNVTVSIEMDEMLRFYHDKKHWLWRAAGHGIGEGIAFRFGTGEHGNLDRLLQMLKPLNIGNAYADGNYAYAGGFHRMF
jgi:IS1 family transposase